MVIYYVVVAFGPERYRLHHKCIPDPGHPPPCVPRAGERIVLRRITYEVTNVLYLGAYRAYVEMMALTSTGPNLPDIVDALEAKPESATLEQALSDRGYKVHAYRVVLGKVTRYYGWELAYAASPETSVTIADEPDFDRLLDAAVDALSKIK